MSGDIHVFDCTDDVPDEEWRRVERLDRACECGGRHEYYSCERNGRLLICHRDTSLRLTCALATHQTGFIDLMALPGRVADVAHGVGT